MAYVPTYIATCSLFSVLMCYKALRPSVQNVGQGEWREVIPFRLLRILEHLHTVLTNLPIKEAQALYTLCYSSCVEIEA